MLTVVIDARANAQDLPALLSQLTAGAVDGLVRQVLIVAAPDQPGVDELCEDMGAEAHATLPSAGRAARSERLMVLPASLRLRDGWIRAIADHLARGGGDAVVVGLETGGFFARPPFGLLVQRHLVEQGVDRADLKALRRGLSAGARRVG